MDQEEVMVACRTLFEKIQASYEGKKTKPDFFYELVFLQGVLAGRESINAEKQKTS